MGYRFFLGLVFFVFTFFGSVGFSTDSEAAFVENKTIFMGVLIKNYDQLVGPFLKSLEKLDYDKKLMTLQLDVYNNTPAVRSEIEKWVSKNQGKWSKITCAYSDLDKGLDPAVLFFHPIKKFELFGEIRNNYLKKTKELNSDYCFIVDSDVFLTPCALKELMKKEVPIITPVLRPIPEANDPYCNFFCTANEEGFSYKENVFLTKIKSVFYPEYSFIADRRKLGVAAVVSAFGAYLIRSEYVDKLSFKDSIISEDFFALARSAKENKIDHYICNEKEFGFFIHFHRDLSLEEEKKFRLVGSDIEVNSDYIKKALSKHIINDQDLSAYLKETSFDDYLIYRIENRDLFYLDDISDWIKVLYLKKGSMWERQVKELLNKYIKPGTTAVDIGGHVGSHTLTMSRLVGEKGTVHVFEPQIKLFPELVINMSLNQCKNIAFHRKALGNERKQVTLENPSSENEGMCRVSLSSQVGQKVDMQKLDDFHLRNVSIMKIDVEGLEYDVIEGAKETILKSKPVIIIEISQRFEKMKESLNNLGYEVFSLGQEDYLCLPKK